MDVFTRIPSDLLVYGQGERDWDRYDPDRHDQQNANEDLHPWLERVHDDKVAIYGNSRGSKSGHVHADPQGHGDEVAEKFPEDPVLEKPGDRREGYGQHTHHNVRDSKVSDEDICDRLHWFVPYNNVNNQWVSGHPKYEDHCVKGNQDALQPRLFHDVIIWRLWNQTGWRNGSGARKVRHSVVGHVTSGSCERIIGSLVSHFERAQILLSKKRSLLLCGWLFQSVSLLLVLEHDQFTPSHTCAIVQYTVGLDSQLRSRNKQTSPISHSSRSPRSSPPVVFFGEEREKKSRPDNSLSIYLIHSLRYRLHFHQVDW